MTMQQSFVKFTFTDYVFSEKKPKKLCFKKLRKKL